MTPLTPFPSDLRALLDELVSGAQSALGKEFVGAYLVGSFALGAGDAHSDVDFIVVTRTLVAGAALDALQALHGHLHMLPTPWARHLEGSYLPLEALWHPDPTTLWVPYLDNGRWELLRSNHNCTLVDRWTLRERGIALAGPPPATLAAPVPPEALRAEIRAVMRRWGDELRQRRGGLWSRWGQPFAVLGFCRMLHSLESGVIASKEAGARWAIATLPAEWHPLIERAWAERADPWTKVHLGADPEEAMLTRRFVAWAMAHALRGA